jgi:hypothetical protein
MKNRKKNRCEDHSPIYREILNSKFNSKILNEGNIRIGDEFYLNIKTNLINTL